MKTLIFCLLSLQSLAQTTILELGQSKNYPGTTEHIWIEKSTILTAGPSGNGVRLTAKKVGSSKVRINAKNETIEVLHPDQMALYEKLQKVVLAKPGLHADVEDGEVVVKGYLHDWQTWKALAQQLDFSTYRMKAELSPELKNSMQKNFDEDLRAQGLLSVNVILQPNLEVRLNPQQGSLDRYRDYFQRLGISVVVSAESLELVPVVRVDITVVEIKKDFSRKLGLEPMAQAQFQVLPNKIVNAENIMATLHAMESSGDAKLLASPNLLCRSGKEAEFMAGGEFPVKISSFKYQEVIWKKYGVLLKIKPTADSTGRISLSIETEVSDIADTKEDVPSIIGNRVSSQFDLSHSQVVALSGLLRNNETKAAKGLPYLTNLPILGPLFSSHDYHNQKTELVIFVRPQLLDQQPANEWTRGASHAVTNL